MSDETIMPGAEPFFFKGNDIGVLVCHGFTGTTQSMRYLGEQLHGAGYTVIGPRLKGHGISPAAMARTTAADWIASVDEALEELRKTCSQIYMTGLSMGGTLTLFTAASHADVIKGAIPINAVVQIGNPDMAGLAFGRGLPDTVPGIGSDVKDPNSKELAYAGGAGAGLPAGVCAGRGDARPAAAHQVSDLGHHIARGPRRRSGQRSAHRLRRGFEPRRAGLAGELVPCGHHRP